MLRNFSVIRSGTNEDLTEKKNLLQEICDLIESGAEIVAMKNAELKAKEKEEKKKLRLKQKGEDIRLRAMQGLKGMRLCSLFICRNVIHKDKPPYVPFMCAFIPQIRMMRSQKRNKELRTLKSKKLVVRGCASANFLQVAQLELHNICKPVDRVL